MGGPGSWRRAGDWIDNEEYLKLQLPYIRGQWHYVDPQSGSDTGRNGHTLDSAFDGFLAAYDACTSGAGDGIAVISSGTTSADTTSYLTAVLDWTKYAITTVGIAAGGFYGRARLAAPASADLAYLIDVQGQNNRFINIHMANYGDASGAIGCLKVTGDRNRFWEVHTVGAGHTTPGTVGLNPGTNYGAHDLMVASSENVFDHCIFGSNSVLRAASAANIIFGGQMSKNHFDHCRTLVNSTTAGVGAIGLYAIEVLNGWITFQDCIFTCWYGSEVHTNNTSLLIGSEATNSGILMVNSGMIGWNEWDDATSSRLYVTNAQGNADGGKGVAAG